MTTPVPQPWRRAVAALLAFLLALGPLGTPAYAAVTDLADEPVAFVPSAAPNVVMTVDDSTSMLADFLPDYVIGAVPNTGVSGFCRDATGAMSVACGFKSTPSTPDHIYHQNGIPFPTYASGKPPNAGNYTASSGPLGVLNQWPAPVHSNALNRLYYDPSITYRPPLDSAGVSLPNQTTFAKVPADPWLTEVPAKTIDLATTVNVGMWCNSDWPLDQNWDPATGGGNHCRINGTHYDQAFHVPQTKGDYQYPWSKQGVAPNDRKYFWRNGTAKTIYCDMTSAKWPQNCSGWKCNTGVYIPNSKPQTCVAGAPRMGCDPTVPTDYTPAGCNTNPAYGSPGPCTKGAECLACACNNTRQIGRNGTCRDAVTLVGGSGGNCGCNNVPPGVPCSLLACGNYNPGGVGVCSDGSPPVPNCVAATGQNCGSFLVNPVTKVATAVSLYQDSETNGEVCRHNNWAYPDGTIAAPFNYPSGKFKTAVNGGTINPGPVAVCRATTSQVARPRHYWKTSVEWCNARIPIGADDKWRGFGQAGACQDDRDLTHPYPRFYKYGVAKTDVEYTDNYIYPAFERVDLVAANAPFVHTFQRNGVSVTISRTWIEEATNYANWFAYYRTRILAAKTVISQNFSFLDDQFRVGFHTLSNSVPASWVNVNPFDAGQKAAWYAQLFGVQITMGRDTPSMDAMIRIGELFKNGASATLAGATDPIVLSCQRNFHMLFTDGMQYQVGVPAVAVGNRDNTIAMPYDLPSAAPPLANGAPWPKLYRENTVASLGNTLADYSTYYWATDLRPGMTDNVILSNLAGKDPAPWQHVGFAALSLGTEGILNAKSTGATEALISVGPLVWPTPAPNATAPLTGGVDDLWHAAVNGRGRFINAKTSQELGRGILSILLDLSLPKGTDAGAAFGSPNLSPTNKHIYIASFDGSQGTVKKIELDPATAAPAPVPALWDAATELTTQVTPAAGFPDPWNTLRNIVTVNTAGATVSFQQATISGAQRLTLGPDPVTQTGVVEYLRGSQALEGNQDGQLRTRSTPLGDIVNSSPVAVGPPNWAYQDATDPGYTAFKTANLARPTRVYVGANDGMLHAFDDADGKEAWAFIPRDLFRSAPDDKEGLIGLTYQVGGLPFYEHRYFVNATPRVVDVDFGGMNWRTLLVGGLGKGGKSIYALDVTDPASVVDEATASSKVLWEFRHADLGYTFGKPVIVKTRAHGWVVIVPSGYNNHDPVAGTGDGKAKIFVLNASTGALLKVMDTGFGAQASPAGLAHISGYVKDYRNQTVEQVYGGDLYGNVWRFDLSDPNAALWTTGLFATLKDLGGTVQPVTTPPQIEVDLANGVDRWVFVGTGRLLHENDLLSSQQQTMYALRDGSYDTPNKLLPGAGGLPPLTRADLDLVNNLTGLGAGVIAAKGWYDDLPVDSRMITAPVAAISVVGYVATGIATDPCQAGQPADVFVREFGNGKSALEDPPPVGSPPGTPGTPTESIHVVAGGAALNIVTLHDAACTGDCIPEFRIVVSTKSDSTVVPLRIVPPGFVAQHRLSFRFLNQ